MCHCVNWQFVLGGVCTWYRISTILLWSKHVVSSWRCFSRISVSWLAKEATNNHKPGTVNGLAIFTPCLRGKTVSNCHCLTLLGNAGSKTSAHTWSRMHARLQARGWARDFQASESLLCWDSQCHPQHLVIFGGTSDCCGNLFRLHRVPWENACLKPTAGVTSRPHQRLFTPSSPPPSLSVEHVLGTLADVSTTEIWQTCSSTSLWSTLAVWQETETLKKKKKVKEFALHGNQLNVTGFVKAQTPPRFRLLLLMESFEQSKLISGGKEVCVVKK